MSTAPPVPRYTLLSGYALSAILAFGILTLWVRDRWALTVFQLAVFDADAHHVEHFSASLSRPIVGALCAETRCIPGF